MIIYKNIYPFYNMKRNLITSLSIIASIFIISVFWNSAFSRSYPLKNIALTDGEQWTIQLPLISNANYYAYKKLTLYRKVYSMLRLSTYYGNRDSGVGSHQWVDIVTAIWTPVYASYEWVVIVAGEKWDWWNVIVIQHEWNSQIYYTVYAHLSEIFVNVWDIVSEWDEIGKTWKSGNVTWPHLHFQIETNTNWVHPFFPSGCEGTIDEIVNEWNCILEIKDNTIDPIVFFEQTTKLAISSELENSESLYIPVSEINISWFKWWFLETWSISKLTISSKSSIWKLLLSPIQILYDSKYLAITPAKIQTLVWDRTIFIQSKDSTGITIISVKYWAFSLIRIPVLIWSPETISLRKKNAKLVETLQLLWINV